MTSYGTVGKGLWLIFIGQILGILSIFPVMVLISAVLLLVGLYIAGKGEVRLRPAFVCGIAELLVAVLSAWTPSLILTVAVTVLDVLIVYYICSVTSDLLDALGKRDMAKWGRVVWKIYLLGIVAMNMISLAVVTSRVVFWSMMELIVAINLGIRFVIGMILLLHLYHVYSTFEEQERSNGGAS
ncbi:hypothetical protein [Flavonifractor porci]|uniref:hypothetical protein n=1 Tax=Flavonifractor porci TaxID=3133422 RepID=UPI0030A31056